MEGINLDKLPQFKTELILAGTILYASACYLLSQQHLFFDIYQIIALFLPGVIFLGFGLYSILKKESKDAKFENLDKINEIILSRPNKKESKLEKKYWGDYLIWGMDEIKKVSDENVSKDRKEIVWESFSEEEK